MTAGRALEELERVEPVRALDAREVPRRYRRADPALGRGADLDRAPRLSWERSQPVPKGQA